jgi:hypothetical protein
MKKWAFSKGEGIFSQLLTKGTLVGFLNQNTRATPRGA